MKLPQRQREGIKVAKTTLLALFNVLSLIILILRASVPRWRF